MQKEEYKAIYEIEETYWWYVALHDLVDKALQKEVASTELQIFDAGCGTGRMMQILKKYGHVSGIDYSEEAVKFCNKRGNLNVKQKDLNKWVTNTQFDVIVSLDVLYHKAIIDDIAVLTKFHSALKQKGVLILNLAAFPFLKRNHDKIVSTQRRYYKNKLLKELKNIGFEPYFSTYRVFPLFFIALIQKFIEKIQKKEAASDLKRIPEWLNNFMLFIHRLENKYILWGGKIPVGTSLFIVALKK